MERLWEHYEGDPKKWNLLIKLCIYSYRFKLQSPSKYSPLDAIHLSRCFFHCSQQFLNLLILRPFSASAIFYFISSTLAKCFPLRIFFFSSRETKKVMQWEWNQMNRAGGAWGSSYFWSKTAEHSAPCGQVCSWITHHEMAKALKKSSKNKFTKAEHSLSQKRQQVQMGS